MGRQVQCRGCGCEVGHDERCPCSPLREAAPHPTPFFWELADAGLDADGNFRPGVDLCHVSLKVGREHDRRSVKHRVLFTVHRAYAEAMVAAMNDVHERYATPHRAEGV